MKVLFLDVNGVLCLGYTGTLNHIALQNLKRIHDETGCLIVMASSWRNSGRRLKVVEDALFQMGIPALIGTTGVGRSRAHEILEWIEAWNTMITTVGQLEGMLKAKRDPETKKAPEKDGLSPHFGHPRIFEWFVGSRLESGDLQVIQSWVSVDDEPTLKKGIPGNLVMTNTMKGLTGEDADTAIRILSRK